MSKIGIFDSGLGGLSVMRHLTKELPDYDYVYYGDSANSPYGSKDQETVTKYTISALKFLISQNCDLIIIACNTASAMALRYIQTSWLPKYYPAVKILGVLIPMSETAVKLSRKGKIGVIATVGTVSTGSFSEEINKLSQEASTTEQPCPELVPLIESGMQQTNKLLKQLKIYLQPLIVAKIDCLVLGCTHYELIVNEIKSILPTNVKIVDGGSVAEKLISYLVKHPEVEAKLSKNHDRTFYSSGDLIMFNSLGTTFYGDNIFAKNNN